MNFEEWYKHYDDYNYTSEHAPKVAKDSWDACKAEVLKLLDTYTATDEYIDTSVIKEIAKL